MLGGDARAELAEIGVSETLAADDEERSRGFHWESAKRSKSCG
jgi:hypothetical protein